MLSVRVSRMGKTRVVFIDPGVNSSYCCNIVLEKGLLPDIRAICRHYRWTLQQDGAPAHTARTTMDYLITSTSTSLNLTCGLQIALILSRGLRYLGCSSATSLPPTTVQDVGRTAASGKNSQRFIDNSVNEWRRRLETVFKNGGGHIEHWAAANHSNTIER